MEVFFGTPSYDKTLSVDYTHSMVESSILLTRMGVEIHHHVLAGNCFLGMARNAIVKAFLATAATDLIFVDSDIGWDARVLPRVLNHTELIVAGLVPKRDTTTDSCYHQNALTGVIQNGLFQAFEAPTAFMRIKREVFGKLSEPYFRAESSPEDYGEDIYFCRKWCALGEFLWIDADINFSHRGSKVWKGNFYEHAVATGLLKSS